MEVYCSHQALKTTFFPTTGKMEFSDMSRIPSQVGSLNTYMDLLLSHSLVYLFGSFETGSPYVSQGGLESQSSWLRLPNTKIIGTDYHTQVFRAKWG